MIECTTRIFLLIALTCAPAVAAAGTYGSAEHAGTYVRGYTSISIGRYAGPDAAGKESAELATEKQAFAKKTVPVLNKLDRQVKKDRKAHAWLRRLIVPLEKAEQTIDTNVMFGRYRAKCGSMHVPLDTVTFGVERETRATAALLGLYTDRLWERVCGIDPTRGALKRKSLSELASAKDAKTAEGVRSALANRLDAGSVQRLRDIAIKHEVARPTALWLLARSEHSTIDDFTPYLGHDKSEKIVARALLMLPKGPTWLEANEKLESAVGTVAGGDEKVTEELCRVYQCR